MSRGAGRVMRELEQRLTPRWTPVAILAREIYETDEPTRAQMVAALRASRRLQALGRATFSRGHVNWLTGGVTEEGYRVCEDYWSAVRTPITADDIEQAKAQTRAASRGR